MNMCPCITELRKSVGQEEVEVESDDLLIDANRSSYNKLILIAE